MFVNDVLKNNDVIFSSNFEIWLIDFCLHLKNVKQLEKKLDRPVNFGKTRVIFLLILCPAIRFFFSLSALLRELGSLC